VRGSIVVLLALLVMSTITRAADVGAPDFAALRAAGQATAARLRAGPAAAWRVTGVTPANVTMAADVLDSPGCRRIIFSAQSRAVPKTLVPVGTLFETRGAWYHVDHDGRHRKHRPHEAVLPLMMTELLRELASPRLISDGDDPAALGRFVARRGDVARYAAPAPGERRAGVADGRGFLNDGPSVAVDVRTGIVTEFITAHAAFTVTGFRHLPALLRDELNPELQTWEDYTDDPTAKGRPENLVMFGHSPFWRAGDPIPEPGAVLYDLATGRFRRVPFAGVQAIPGCFVKDRSAVVVTGMNADHVSNSLYRVDLKTGANRKLGGGTLPPGDNRVPALSPDGTSIAFLHTPDGGPVSGAQVVVIDLATDAVRKVGQSVHGAFLNWLPNGTGFVLSMRPDANRKPEDADRIYRMDLDGKVTLLCDGNSPTVLVGRKAIAFEAPDHAWRLCDLDGSNPRPLGTAGAQFASASPSSDDNRLLMLGDGKNGPATAVYDLSTQTYRFLDLPKGLWAISVWR